MGLNFGQSLFPPRGELITSYDWTSLITGNGYITLLGSLLIPPTTKIESYETGADTNVNTDGTNRAAQTFTIGTTGTNATYYPIKFRFRGTVVTTTMEIQETTAGEPNGSVLIRLKGTPIKVTDETSSADDWQELNISHIQSGEVIKLQQSTMYALVIYTKATSATYVRKDDNDATYDGGQLLTSTDDGANWTANAGDDLNFQIIGSTTNPYSLSSATTTTSTSTSFTTGAISKDADNQAGIISFEATFNTSNLIEGVAFLDYAFTMTNEATAGSNAEIFHIRGTTETSIGSAVALFNDKSPSLQINLTRTKISKGDKIKLTIKATYLDGGADTIGTFLHNPATPDLALKLPFKIDI